MPGIAEGDVHAVQHREGFVVAVRDQLLHGLLGIGNAVERLDGRLMLFGAPLETKSASSSWMCAESMSMMPQNRAWRRCNGSGRRSPA